MSFLEIFLAQKLGNFSANGNSTALRCAFLVSYLSILCVFPSDQAVFSISDRLRENGSNDACGTGRRAGDAEASKTSKRQSTEYKGDPHLLWVSTNTSCRPAATVVPFYWYLLRGNYGIFGIRFRFSCHGERMYHFFPQMVAHINASMQRLWQDHPIAYAVTYSEII